MANILMYNNQHKIDSKWVEIESQFLKRRKKSRFMKTFCLTCPAGAVGGGGGANPVMGNIFA